MAKNVTVLLTLLFLSAAFSPAAGADLEEGFRSPPVEARLHAYWWWLNGNVTAEAITRDLEAMKEKGFGGALIMDAGGANQDGNRQVPKGPLFGSEPWRELYRHALREGTRLKLEMGLNIQSGWNLGGPGVTPEDAAKILCWTETGVIGPKPVTLKLPVPPSRNGFLRDVAVLAVPDGQTETIQNWEVKTLVKPVHGGNGDTAREIAPTPKTKGVSAVTPEQVIDLSKFMAADGQLTWAAPEGSWRIYRLCYTVAPRARVSTCTQGWEGLALDPMDARAFQRYWDAVVEPLMLDAAQVEGSTLKYLHTDSWEIEPFNWTTALPAEFQRRCGYEMTPWLPVLARRVVGSAEASERFLHDFRKTVAALIAENYYGPFLKNAHRHGLQVRAESGGPHGVPIDAQHCLGIIDVPMSEFWATSWRHRVTEQQRFFVKQPASAAHTYGKRIVAAEGFTTIGPHWQETVWDNLKPNFDHALCEGLNQLVWTLVDCSPRAMGMPGQVMFAGTHFNPNSTWWRQSEGFLSYINRCQWMLRQGLFVADVLYYYGDLAPNSAGLRSSNPAGLPFGYDYDVATEHVILNRLSVRDGRMTLPDGMSYAALVLPPHPHISLRVLHKLAALAQAGGVIIGPRPESSSGLKDWQKEGDREARDLITRLWGADGRSGLVQYATAAEWLKKDGLMPDVAVMDDARIEYIHRRADAVDIYFVANPSGQPLNVSVNFRMAGRIPEFWDPRTGSIRPLPEWRQTADGRMRIPLAFDAFGSAIVVFRKPIGDGGVGKSQGVDGKNFPVLANVQEVTGPWEVAFDPAWFYPDDGSGGKRVFEKLEDWTKRPEAAIRHFSGAAVYRTRFDMPVAPASDDKGLVISLGEVREMARVTVNDHDLGIAWCPPWTVQVPPGALKEKENRLEIEVVNFWPNRLIGDAKQPPGQRRTRTNITKFEEPKGDPHYMTLSPSGLLGPVRIMIQKK